MSPARLRALTYVVVVSLMAVFFVQAYVSSLEKSLTWDEPTSIGGGYALLAYGDYSVYLESPPLLQRLQALGLYLDGTQEPAPELWRGRQNPKVWFGTLLTYYSGNDPHRIARQARLPGLLLGTALVGLLFWWGRLLLGVPAALGVTTLAAFSPNLIGHSRVAAADLGSTVFMLGAVAAFWWASETGAVRRWTLCGILAGTAILSKFSALLLAPIFVALVAGLWFLRPDTRDPKWVGTAALAVGLATWLTVALGYGLDLDLSMLREGVARIYSDAQPEYQDYLLGRVSEDPFWYSNVVAYLLKVPVATLILLLLAAVQAVRSRDEHTLEVALFTLTPVLIVVAAACFDTRNLGLRRILPAFPFLLLFAGLALREIRSRAHGWAVAALVVWAVASGVSIFPHHLSYFNVLAGGPENGPFLLSDSNIDWGQDLPALAAWQATRPEGEELNLRYFGTADPAAYGVRAVLVPDEELRRPRRAVYAMSVTELVNLRKSIARGVGVPDWLTQFQPIARAGYSIYIYDFRSPGEPPPF